LIAEMRVALTWSSGESLAIRNQYLYSAKVRSSAEMARVSGVWDERRPSGFRSLLRLVESNSYEIDYIDRIPLWMIAHQPIHNQ